MLKEDKITLAQEGEEQFTYLTVVLVKVQGLTRA